MSPLRQRVAAAQRWLTAIYRLEVDLRADDFLLPPEQAREMLPPQSPRTGVLVVEEAGELWLGLYVDRRDELDGHTIVEETSHLLCLAWHAGLGRPVSRLHLELQAEVDRYAVARLRGRDRLGHFERFRWASWMDAEARRRYETAHAAAHRYCRRLEARFPQTSDTPAWLSELRRFYRSGPAAKLRSG